MIEREQPKGAETEGVEVEFARWESNEDRAGSEEAERNVVFEACVLVLFARRGWACGWLWGRHDGWRLISLY